MAFFLLFNSFIGNATEQTMGPNTTLQLIDDIRAKVHAADLLAAFRSRGIRDAADLVALSGAHTIGRAICPFFQDRADRKEDDFARQLKPQGRLLQGPQPAAAAASWTSSRSTP